MTDASMIALDQQTPEQHRQRYDALRSQARERSTRQPGVGCPPLAADQVLQREIIPGGWYWSARVQRGHTLRVVNTAGSSSVAVLLWNADEVSERFNAADTVKVQWTVRLGTGHLLLSDMGRVLASITANTGGWHDMLLGGSTRASNQRRYGHDNGRNTRDNFLLAAAKHGLDRRDIPPCLTLFADVRADDLGRLTWFGTGEAGGAVDLRAEMDLVVALSNCPHPLDPKQVYAPEPVEVAIWRSGAVAADDFCRTGSPEAVRAFENNTRMFCG